MVAAVFGGLLLLPPGYFRAFHLSHHRFTQDPARDPELSGRTIKTRSDYLLHVSGMPYWATALHSTWRHALGRVEEAFLPQHQHRAIVSEAQLYLAAYALLAGVSLAAGSWLLVWLWVLPALLGQPFLRLYLLAEHWDCPREPDMLVNSRTTATNRVVSFLCWNMNRHTAHHAFPRPCPFTRCPPPTVCWPRASSSALWVTPGCSVASGNLWRARDVQAQRATALSRRRSSEAVSGRRGSACADGVSSNRSISPLSRPPCSIFRSR